MSTRDPEKLKAKRRRWYLKNKDRILLSNSTSKAETIRSNHLERKFGMSLAEWNAVLNSQGNRCACCGSYDPCGKYGWHTDHSHETGEFRAILCRPCNIALGLVDDSVERLQKLIDYLRKHHASD